MELTIILLLTATVVFLAVRVRQLQDHLAAVAKQVLALTRCVKDIATKL